MRTDEFGKIYQMEQVSVQSIPDGEYHGTWCGYTIGFDINGKYHESQVNEGIGGMSPCIVRVQCGVISAETTR